MSLSLASKVKTDLSRAVLCVSLPVLALSGALSSAAAETITITMKSGPNRYEPKSQPVKIGDTVEWVNEAGQHTATPDAGQPEPFQASPTLNSGQKYSVVISGSPRTIKYHCAIHGPAMSGELVIGR